MLSMKAKYALRAMMVLARDANALLQTRVIADEADVPPKFLESILSDLRNHGLVSSRRGAAGGYSLSKSADEIMIGDVVRMMDGPLAPIRCASVTAYQKCDDCEDEKKCEIRRVMVEVRNAIAGVLDRKTLREMMEFGGGWSPLIPSPLEGEG